MGRGTEGGASFPTPDVPDQVLPVVVDLVYGSFVAITSYWVAMSSLIFLLSPVVALESYFWSSRSSVRVTSHAWSIVCLSRFSRSSQLNSMAPARRSSMIPQIIFLAAFSWPGSLVSFRTCLMKTISSSPLAFGGTGGISPTPCGAFLVMLGV